SEREALIAVRRPTAVVGNRCLAHVARNPGCRGPLEHDGKIARQDASVRLSEGAAGVSGAQPHEEGADLVGSYTRPSDLLAGTALHAAIAALCVAIVVVTTGTGDGISEQQSTRSRGLLDERPREHEAVALGIFGLAAVDD